MSDERKYYLYWCYSCSGDIRESPPHLTRIYPLKWSLRCDCCGIHLATWKKEVSREDYYKAIKTYQSRRKRR